MAGWTESGIYANVFLGNLNLTAAYPNWTLNTNKFYLTTNSDTPTWQAAAGSAIYAVTYEVSGTGWAAGGVAASALGAGPTDIVLNWTVTGTPPTTTLNYKAANVSVATTTIATGVYGGYFYYAAGATKYSYIGIYFGGSPYTTSAGTFAITWSSGTIATFALAS